MNKNDNTISNLKLLKLGVKAAKHTASFVVKNALKTYRNNRIKEIAKDISTASTDIGTVIRVNNVVGIITFVKINELTIISPFISKFTWWRRYVSQGEMKWGSIYPNDSIGDFTHAIDMENGQANHDKIITIYEHSIDHDDHPAFDHCRCVGEGWYLPAVNELLNFFCSSSFPQVFEALRGNGFPLDISAAYWTSTEYNNESAYAVQVSDKGEIKCVQCKKDEEHYTIPFYKYPKA